MEDSGIDSGDPKPTFKNDDTKLFIVRLLVNKLRQFFANIVCTCAFCFSPVTVEAMAVYHPRPGQLQTRVTRVNSFSEDLKPG